MQTTQYYFLFIASTSALICNKILCHVWNIFSFENKWNIRKSLIDIQITEEENKGYRFFFPRRPSNLQDELLYLLQLLRTKSFHSKVIKMLNAIEIFK